MDRPQPEMPEMEPAADARRRWQFSLRWIFVLMAIVAATSGIVRYAAGNLVLQIAIVCLAMFAVYLVLRSQSLLFHSLELRRIRANRRKLGEWARWRRNAQNEDDRGE